MPRDREDGPQGVDSNELFIDGLEIPVEDRIGEEGKGFQYLLHGMNPERILIAAEADRHRPRRAAKATDYAKERIVFDRPIGQNQAIQHPLAENWMELEAADLLTLQGGLAVRQRRGVRGRGQRRQVPRGRSGLPRLRARRC